MMQVYQLRREIDLMTPSANRRMRITRDMLITCVALILLVYEVRWGGARPAVLTILGVLLGAPLAIRADEARRSEKRDQPDDTRHSD